uniref:Rev protein n=1 Tax=Small ruminant lentivirus TaxID=254355 RepID=E0ZN16_CAEV|nr:rev protein [Small ruminant lentivirus]
MDAGAKHIRFTGEETWCEVTMGEEGKKKQEGCNKEQQDIQNIKYPKIPTGHSHLGNKSRRRRRKSGFWRWLRGIRRQRNTPKDGNKEGLVECVGALAELTLDGVMEEESAEAAHHSTDDGNLDKWTAWRTPPQK